MNGKVFLDRKILDWEWYGDLKTCRLFIHILIKANWKDNNWRGIVIKRGSFITSVSHLSEETSMTAGEIRTALDHLEKTGEIRRKTTNRHTHITVVNYDKYQIGVQSDVRKSTNQTQESRYSNHFVDYVKKNEVVSIPNVEVRAKEESDNDIEKMTDEEWMNMSGEEFGKMYYGN